ncbi:hypothetical protein Neosp_015245 [[Neocosmospora] mangrovei]
MSVSKSPTSIPTLRWGIIGSGTVAAWFSRDLLLPRKDAKIRHIVHAVGSRGAATLTEKVNLPSETKLYSSHADVYADPEVDIVQIAVPHGLHLKECLAGIEAGKHILAARKARVWVGEGLWTRVLPITKRLIEVLHVEKAIGSIQRIVSDFGFRVDVTSLPWTSRYKDPALGAGSLLDMGVYSVNWALIAAGVHATEGEEIDVDLKGYFPTILATQTLEEVAEGQYVDIATGVLLQFGSKGPQAILSCTSVTKSEGGDFCRIDGSEGYIIVTGRAPPLPSSFTVYKYEKSDGSVIHGKSEEGDAAKKYECESPGGMCFYWEADEAGLDIAAGRTTSSMMPWSQTMKVTRN